MSTRSHKRRVRTRVVTTIPRVCARFNRCLCDRGGAGGLCAKSRDITRAAAESSLFVAHCSSERGALSRQRARIGNLATGDKDNVAREKPKFHRSPPPLSPCPAREIAIRRNAGRDQTRRRRRLLFAGISRARARGVPALREAGHVVGGVRGFLFLFLFLRLPLPCALPSLPNRCSASWSGGRSKRRRSPSIPGVSQTGA